MKERAPGVVDLIPEPADLGPAKLERGQILTGVGAAVRLPFVERPALFIVPDIRQIELDEPVILDLRGQFAGDAWRRHR